MAFLPILKLPAILLIKASPDLSPPHATPGMLVHHVLYLLAPQVSDKELRKLPTTWLNLGGGLKTTTSLRWYSRLSVGMKSSKHFILGTGGVARLLTTASKFCRQSAGRLESNKVHRKKTYITYIISQNILFSQVANVKVWIHRQWWYKARPRRPETTMLFLTFPSSIKLNSTWPISTVSTTSLGALNKEATNQ